MSIKVVTWNIDGLCENHRTKRTEHAIDLILNNNPQLVFLQEVIDETKVVIDRKLLQNGYICATLPAPSSVYYTLIYYKSALSIIGTKRLSYVGNAASLMGRDIGLVAVNLNGQEVIFLNSHLERYLYVYYYLLNRM